jgi:proline iminopeptidase
MFYDASVFEKLAESGASFNNDVYCTIGGEDADFRISGDLSNFDFRPNLRTLRLPMLILAGRFDRVAFPSWTEQYKRFAPQAQFIMFEKSGHFPFIEETDYAMQVLRDFLKPKVQ